MPYREVLAWADALDACGGEIFPVVVDPEIMRVWRLEQLRREHVLAADKRQRQLERGKLRPAQNNPDGYEDHR